jgi:predicted TIM-barrel fold metal-dependent hydrolase
MTAGLDERPIALMDRLLDVDSHELVPSHLWADVFGPSAGRIAEVSEPFFRKQGAATNFANPGYPGDVMDITHDNVWQVRGTAAPGACDFSRRTAVLDIMGVERQLVFPSYGLVAEQLTDGNDFILRDHVESTLPVAELREIGRKGLDEYNEWAVRTSQLNPDRIRPVAYLYHAQSVAELFAQATDLVGRGVRAVHLSSGHPPAGMSPAHPDLDPLWALLEANDIPMLLHLGGGFSLMHEAWGRAPAFLPGKVESHEVGLEPYTFSVLHFSPCNYLSVMILGGVFERFPRLRFGVLELGAHWLGALAETLDMWARDVYSTRLKPFISMLPSEYLARNVRVTPFNNIEPIDEHLRRYPHLVDCYCYSTDYPHIEGGLDSKRVLYDRVAPLGDDIVEKFFVTNAELLLPVR